MQHIRHFSHGDNRAGESDWALEYDAIKKYGGGRYPVALRVARNSANSWRAYEIKGALGFPKRIYQDWALSEHEWRVTYKV